MYREIEIFRQVMITKSTSSAAEKLDISQPAVSQAIRRLENKAGVPLFYRARGKLLPTREGLSLMAEVEKFFVGIENIEHRLTALKNPALNSIVLACYPALGNLFVPRALARMKLQEENIRVSLKVQSSKECFETVTSGVADFGFVADEIPVASLEHSLLYKTSGIAVMTHRHPLAAKPIVAPEDLAQYPFIALSPEDTTQQRLEREMAARGLELNVLAETPYSLTVCEMARQGIGVGIVNPVAAIDFVGRGLAIRRFSIEIPFSGLLIFRPDAPLTPACRRLISELRIQLEAELNYVEGLLSTTPA